MAIAKKTAENLVEQPDEKRRTCGIVMPIAAIGDQYTEEHWRRVRKILQRAISRSNMNWQLVWENPEVDVIQSAILQNLYENDVVVCDVSGLNPNVMLEAGIRLSTKRPTVIVTDRLLKPPFDIGTIGYIEYQRDLEFNAIEDFIDRLSKKIINVLDAYDKGNYKSFVENYKFELVTPATVTVTTDQYLIGRLDELADSINRISRSQSQPANKTSKTTSNPRSPQTQKVQTKPFRHFASIIAKIDEDEADLAENSIDNIKYIYCLKHSIGDQQYMFQLKVGDYPAFDLDDTMLQAQNIINELGEVVSVDIVRRGT
jgi:hypothetical protein